MPERFEREKLITLAEAKLLSGYTADHLAYLCRKGYLASERQGRIWLTTASAIADYQKTLATIGQPVLANQQKELLVPRPDLLYQIRQFSRRALQNFEEQIGQAITALRRAFLPPVSAYAIGPSIPALSGFAVGLAPRHLPIGSLPVYLERTPWYQNHTVLMGIFVTLSFVVGFLNPDITKQISQNTEQFVSIHFSAVFEPDEHLDRLAQVISPAIPQVAGASVKAGESAINREQLNNAIEEFFEISSTFQYELNNIKQQIKEVFFDVLKQVNIFILRPLENAMSSFFGFNYT